MGQHCLRAALFEVTDEAAFMGVLGDVCLEASRNRRGPHSTSMGSRQPQSSKDYTNP